MEPQKTNCYLPKIYKKVSEMLFEEIKKKKKKKKLKKIY